VGQGSLLVQKRYIPNEERERRCRDILFSYLALICLKKLGLGDIYPLVACGIGIWSMQAFERRNAEGKTIHRSMTNSKNNWIEKVMNCLLDNFVWLRYKNMGEKKYRKDKR
jgi:hypothetical protein